jgi:molybdopterin-guanine dinucleotide biosynthesis protein A
MGMRKGELNVLGEPILARMIRTIDWPGPTLLVTAPGTDPPPGADAFDAACADDVADRGPLQGVLTALTRAGDRPVVVMPVDMPRVRRDHLSWIASKLAESDNLLGVLVRRADTRAVEPFPLAVRPDAIDVVRDRLDRGFGSVRRLTEVPGFGVVDAPDDWAADVWEDLDTPADLARFESRASRERTE